MNAPDTKRWDWGDLRRLQPVSREFGYERGLPVDRYYIERFLETHRGDVAGRTLEIGERTRAATAAIGRPGGTCSTSTVAIRRPPSSATSPTLRRSPTEPSTAPS